MTGSIHHDAARSFAIGFYGGLGEHESVAVAFEQGRAAINLEGLPDPERPQLTVRAGFDATELILAAVAPSLRQELPCQYTSTQPYMAYVTTGSHGRDAEIDDPSQHPRAADDVDTRRRSGGAHSDAATHNESSNAIWVWKSGARA